MDFKQEWEKSLEKYTIIKRVYIECEETDPELKTNLQPLNEFRAALDHIMKIMYVYYCADVSDDGKKEQELLSQFEKLNSHFTRSFYDICDMLSINYRNKIADTLDIYGVNTIEAAVPEYYSKIKPDIEKISTRIANYRNQKGGYAVDDYDRFSEYKDDILKLRDYYKIVNGASASLAEIKLKNQKETTKVNIKGWLFGGIIGATISAIISVILHFLGI